MNFLEDAVIGTGISKMDELLMVYKTLYRPKAEVEKIISDYINGMDGARYNYTIEEAMYDYNLFIQHYNGNKSYVVLNKEFNTSDSKARIRRYMNLIRAIYTVDKNMKEIRKTINEVSYEVKKEGE